MSKSGKCFVGKRNDRREGGFVGEENPVNQRFRRFGRKMKVSFLK